MSAVGILRLACALVACSLVIVKLVHKDYHTMIYWILVTVYWSIAFIEHLVA